MLTLKVISQEKELLEVEADSITATTSSGEVTILPGHIPLFSRLVLGDLVYRINGVEHHIVVTKGFLDVSKDSVVTVIVDSATLARDISEQRAQTAITDAHKTRLESRDTEELIMAEASLKLALLEVKVAQKSKKSQI